MSTINGCYLFTFVIFYKDGSKGVFECNANTVGDAWEQFYRLDISGIDNVKMTYRCNF